MKANWKLITKFFKSDGASLSTIEVEGKSGSI